MAAQQASCNVTGEPHAGRSPALCPQEQCAIAALLASLHDDLETHTIELPAWSRGQQIAERWRASLHRLMGQVQDEVTLTHEEKAEHALIRVLRKYGSLTVRDLQQRTKIPDTVVVRHLDLMGKAGVVQARKSGRTIKYQWLALDGLQEAHHKGRTEPRGREMMRSAGAFKNLTQAGMVSSVERKIGAFL